ncbi:MAG: DUF1631 domain-containing protein [Pseudomonadales bacterium]|nr:DUF1631 domain-containing protein [Pseudomonadales bacterium]
MISKTSFNNEQPSSAAASSKTLPVLLEEIQELTIPILAKAFETALDKTDTSFFQRAEKGKNNNEQNLYFDAMRALRLGRESAEQSFDKGLREQFSNFPFSQAGSRTTGELNQGLELSLVQNDDLEEDIALETMVSKSTADNKEAIYHLSMRLDSLVADTHIDEINNPLSPISISEVLALASAGIELDIRCKIILYKQLDLTVMASLKAVLQKSNQVLIDAGVLPDLRYEASKHEGQSSDRAEQLTEALVSNLTELAELDTATPGPQFQQLQGLLNKARASGFAPVRFGTASGIHSQGDAGQQGSSSSFGSILTSNELIGVLDSVQSQIEIHGDYLLNHEVLHSNSLRVIPPSVIRASLRDALATNDAQGAKSLEDENEDIINLVEMLFEVILDDEYLPDTIQALISRLQIPIVKVALKDKSFFNLPNHPARKLLNELARISIGWVPGKEGRKDNLLESIYDVVRVICSAQEVSVELFEEQFQVFRKLCAKDRKRSELSEKRTKEYEVGASKVKHAKTVIKLELDALCVERIIPRVVQDLLYEGWNKVLYSTYLNEGPLSQKWIKQLQTAEDLIWSVQPRANAGYQAKRAKLLPDLLQNLHYGFTEISYDPFEVNALFSRLESTHIAAFKAGDPGKSSDRKDSNNQQADNSNGELKDQNDDIEIFVKQSKHKINLASKKPKPNALVIDEEIKSMLKNLESNDAPVSEDLLGLDTAMELQESKLNAQVKFAAAKNEEINDNDQPLTAIQRQKAELEKQEAHYLEKVNLLGIDTWFIFQTDNGSEIRCKLIEKIANTETLVFVNRKGQKVFVKSYLEMASDLRTNAVRMLEGGSLLDRAFGRLVGKLKTSD